MKGRCREGAVVLRAEVSQGSREGKRQEGAKRGSGEGEALGRERGKGPPAMENCLHTRARLTLGSDIWRQEGPWRDLKTGVEGTEKGSLGREILEEHFPGHSERWGERGASLDTEAKRVRCRETARRDPDGAGETGLQPRGGGANQARAALLKGT